MSAFCVIVTTQATPDEHTLYLLGGTLTADAMPTLSAHLLCDPITQSAVWYDLARQQLDTLTHDCAEIAYRPGVTDNEAESIRIGAHHLGVTALTHVRTVRRYRIHPSDQTNRHNELIQIQQLFAPTDTERRLAFYLQLLAVPSARPSHVAVVPLRQSDDAGLMHLSKQGLLALDLDEMRTIQAYYQQLGRDPSDGELETIAQTWSEHCSHKTFKGKVRYKGAPHHLPPERHGLHAALVGLGSEAEIDSLIRHYLMRATQVTAANLTHLPLISAFVDNAGIVAFDDEYELSFKVETHNHPSALEPFGGANTGMGGVLRDVLGVSAKPIAATDVFCFGPRESDISRFAGNVLPPAQVADGVVAGVQDYGNKIGVPIVNGAIFFDAGYIANPLVFCGTVGLAPRNAHPRHVQSGDVIVVLGGRTGRDGIHGATFSSIELTHTTAQEAGSAVQIGDPITEKKLIDVVINARDARLYSAITDCGAGGLSSAIGEMGEQVGARVELSTVPLKYAGLQPWEIWLSEAQERIVMAVPPANLAALLAMCAAEEVEATAVGTFDGSRRLVVTYHDQVVVDIDMHFLHDGRPQRTLMAEWYPPSTTAPKSIATNAQQLLLKLLAHPNIASREPVIRGYDHEIQGRTVVKPLVGRMSDGPGDAAVLHVRPDTMHGVAIGCGMAPQLSQYDPYWMALHAVDEAVRNVVAVGADPQSCAILDNFCWGDPRQPDRMGALTRATAGCHDAALAFGTPFISGKDSLNNEYRAADGTRTAIPGTLLISAMAYHHDIRLAQTSDLKSAGNAVYVVGFTTDAMAGSHASMVAGNIPGSTWQMPQVDLALAPQLMRQLHAAMRAGLVAACHDISEGGLAVAVAEMALAGRMGCHINLDLMPSSTTQPLVRLFSESPSRFVVEVPVVHQAAFQRALDGIPHACIGQVTNDAQMHVVAGGRVVINLPVSDLVHAFRTQVL
ncbi:MAG: phosphoribosylformylglycinamidine synthase subunit PurL [Chloroflexi bacterium]|nr:phosphoribosylformylglycinamidine synthase subunit PurL [Chloroflexota bacterium]